MFGSVCVELKMLDVWKMPVRFLGADLARFGIAGEPGSENA